MLKIPVLQMNDHLRGRAHWRVNEAAGPHRLVVGMIVVVVVAITFSLWTLDKSHFFYADDWGLLNNAQFRSWNDFFHMLPQKLYGDRPGGEIVIRVMYGIFGLDYRWYNGLWLLMHSMNCVLIFVIATKVVPFNRALICALVAACWESMLGAASWIGAIFDLAGATWCLAAVLLYALYARSAHAGRRSLALGVAAVVFHVLAIRTKEFALALIVVLAAWDFLTVEKSGWRERAIRLGPHLAITLVYSLAYAHLYLHHQSFVTSGSYRMSLSLASIIAGIAYYFSGAFYVELAASGAMSMVAGLAVALFVILLALTSRVGRAAIVSAFALLSAVLMLAHQRSLLYLYAPHFFLALALCSVRVHSRVATWATVLAACVLVWWPVHNGSLRNGRQFVLSKGAYSKTLFDDYVTAMRGEPPPREVTVAVSQTYFDPFTNGSGDAIRLFYRSKEIKVNVVQERDDGPGPCAKAIDVCLEEMGGHLIRRK